jgi:hypothetical protein
LGRRQGLPDGIFSNQKSQFRYIFRGLQRKRLVYFMVIWSILRTFGVLVGYFGIFSPVLVKYYRKTSGNRICEKFSQNAVQNVFCRNLYVTVSVEKVAILVGLLRQFSK